MKFSIWDPKNRVMLYGDDGDGFTIQDIANGNFHPLLMTEGGFEAGELRKELVFRPWVGLTDINDTPVCEGDYISFGGYFHKVKWRTEACGFHPFIFSIRPEEILVLGNKYEHTPEDCKQANRLHY